MVCRRRRNSFESSGGEGCTGADSYFEGGTHPRADPDSPTFTKGSSEQSGSSAWRWPGSSLVKHCEQSLSLPRHTVLRND
jgi:hypothetical protein